MSDQGHRHATSEGADGSVIVASSDRLFAEAAGARLEAAGWEVAGVAMDGVQALAALKRHRPDGLLILGDLARLGAGALSRQVRRRWPEVTIVALGEVEGPDAIVLPSDTDGETLLRSLAAAPSSPPEQTRGSAGGMERLRRLTPREHDVLRLVASGLDKHEIAQRLGSSPHTVRTHMQNLYRKLDCHSRLEVVRFAAEHGLLESPPAE